MALDRLERIARLCERIAMANRPSLQGEQPNPDGDWERFREWVAMWIGCEREIAQYHHPKLRAVLVAGSDTPAGASIRFVLEDAPTPMIEAVAIEG